MTGPAQAVAFLTSLGGSRTPTPSALAWFPAVGALLGAALALARWAGGRVWPPLLVAAVVVVVDLALTGMLHADGLADSADGLLPHLPPERRLEVMAAPDVGAFGATVLVGVLLLRVGGLAALDTAAWLLVGLWCASRSLMALVATRVTYARPTGLATAFLGARSWPAVAGLLAAVVASALWRPLAGPLAVLVAVLAGAAVVSLAVRRVGGFTGDVLGAAGVVTETVGLVVAAGRW